MAQRKQTPTRFHEDAGSIPGLTQWVKSLVLLGAVVWVAPIPPLAWELPHAAGVAPNKTNKKIQHFQNKVTYQLAQKKRKKWSFLGPVLSS